MGNVGRYRHKTPNKEPKENRASIKKGILKGVSCCSEFVALFKLCLFRVGIRNIIRGYAQETKKFRHRVPLQEEKQTRELRHIGPAKE